jgi:hypothetical protein
MTRWERIALGLEAAVVMAVLVPESNGLLSMLGAAVFTLSFVVHLLEYVGARKAKERWAGGKRGGGDAQR